MGSAWRGIRGGAYVVVEDEGRRSHSFVFSHLLYILLARIDVVDAGLDTREKGSEVGWGSR